MSRRLRDERDRAATRPLDTTFRIVRRAAVALAATLAVMVLPSSAFGAAKGLETDITWGVSNAVQNQDAAALSDLGVSWTRLTLSWHDAEPTKGSYDSTYLSSFSTALSLARARGINVIVDVYQSPQWASGSGDPEAPPQNPKDYGDFVWQMAHRYAGQAQAWEIWNEENLSRFWGGASPDPAAYANMLKEAYWSVKSADPGAQVVFGGMSESDWSYLDAAYAAVPDLGNFYDAMGVHPYSPPDSPDYVGLDNGHITKDSFAGYREVRRVMLAHGTDKPLYFTEMGWSTTSQAGMGVSAQQQADYTKLAWKCMQQDSYVQVAILYELRNNFWSNDADNWEDQLGLVTTGWSHKPAYDAFRSVDPTQGGCTYHDLHGTPLGPGTELAQPSSGASTGAAGTGAGTSTKKSTDKDKAPTIVLRVKTAPGPHSAQSTKRLKTGVPFKVFGRVVGAKGGHVFLTFQRRIHGKWRNAFRKALSVKTNGTFTTAQLKALAKGGWRVQGRYTASTKPAKSRFVYFKI